MPAGDSGKCEEIMRTQKMDVVGDSTQELLTWMSDGHNRYGITEYRRGEEVWRISSEDVDEISGKPENMDLQEWCDFLEQRVAAVELSNRLLSKQVRGE